MQCYAEFKQAYKEAFAELNLRLQFELETEKRVEEYRGVLKAKYGEEVKRRRKFNSRVVKYLPGSFGPLMMLEPPKYEVLASESVTLLSGLKLGGGAEGNKPDEEEKRGGDTL